MSFGFGFGDIVTALGLIITAYDNIHGAPKQVVEAKIDVESMRQTVLLIQTHLNGVPPSELEEL